MRSLSFAILDRHDGRMPLAALLEAIREHAQPEIDDWVATSATYGYGELPASLEESLSRREATPVTIAELLRSFEEGAEFYNLRLSSAKHRVHAGLIDSTYLYVSAPAALARQIAGHFASVVEREIPGVKRD